MFSARRGFLMLSIVAMGVITAALVGSTQMAVSLQSAGNDFFSCPLSGFLPEKSNVDFASHPPAGSSAPSADYRNITSGFGGTLLCSVHVPHGAKLELIKYDLFSSSATGLPVNVDCFLKRSDHRQFLDAPLAVNISRAPSIRVLGRSQWTATVDESNSRVDNQSFSYYLSCTFPVNDINAGMVGAIVEYQAP